MSQSPGRTVYKGRAWMAHGGVWDNRPKKFRQFFSSLATPKRTHADPSWPLHCSSELQTESGSEKPPKALKTPLPFWHDLYCDLLLRLSACPFPLTGVISFLAAILAKTNTNEVTCRKQTKSCTVMISWKTVGQQKESPGQQ